MNSIKKTSLTLAVAALAVVLCFSALPMDEADAELTVSDITYIGDSESGHFVIQVNDDLAGERMRIGLTNADGSYIGVIGSDGSVRCNPTGGVSPLVAGSHTLRITVFGQDVVTTSITVVEIQFDRNGGAGTDVDSIFATVGAQVVLPDADWTRGDDEFRGWSTSADETVPEFEAEATYTVPANGDVLYAVYGTAPVEEITVNFGAENGTVLPESVTVPAGSTVTVVNGESITIGTETVTSYEGDDASFTYEFVGWFVGETQVAVDMTVENGMTITAKYKATQVVETVKVSFDLNGAPGDAPGSQDVPVGSNVVEPTHAPVWEGFVFDGWYTEAVDGTEYDFDQSIAEGTEDFILYAHWSDVPVKEYIVHIESVEHVTITVMAGDRTITDGDKVADGTELTIIYEVDTGYSMTGSTGPTVKVDGADVTITATVEQILVKEIDIDKPTLSLKVGGTERLSVTVTPEDALDTSVSWSSSNEGVVTVDQDGNVTAVGVGNATITVTAADGSGVFAECEVTVSPADVPSYGVTVGTTEGEGTVTVSQGSVPQGGVVSYTVSPAYGWIVQSVKVNGADQEITGAIGFTGRYTVASDVTIDVVFVEDAQHQAIVTAGDHGSIGAGGATSAQVTVYDHWSATVTIDPDNGYRVSKITPDQDADSISYEDGVLTIAAGSDVTKIDIAFEQIPVSDDDEEYVPPVITVIPGDDDDSTTYIVAIAAGVVVAILAALILMQTRKS